jgi:predicted nucleic-acid-binding protein
MLLVVWVLVLWVFWDKMMYKNVLLTAREIKVLEKIIEQNLPQYVNEKGDFSPSNLTILLRQLKRLSLNQK